MAEAPEFDTVFSDAHVIDVDFSQWDRLIRLVVESDHSEWVDNRLPIFVVEFANVTKFVCDYVHPRVELDDPGQYCQWHIHDYRKEASSDQMEIKLISTGPAPDLSIACTEVRFEQIGHEVLDSLFGNWDRPYSPLVRPSIRELYAAFFER